MPEVTQFTGEKCRCGAPATHKIGEEAALNYEITGHNYTQYVCDRHFDEALRPYTFQKEPGVGIQFITPYTLDEEKSRQLTVSDTMGFSEERYHEIVDQLEAYVKKEMGTDMDGSISGHIRFIASICKTNEEFGHICLIHGSFLQTLGMFDEAEQESRRVASEKRRKKSL